jgi:hypothetical protein
LALSFSKVEMKKCTKPSLCRTLFTAGLFLVVVTEGGVEKKEPVYSGSLRTSYDYRSMGSDSDQDAYAYWHLRGRNLADRHVEIYTSGRLHSDLDGSSNYYAKDPLISLDDTSRDDQVRLLQLYVDWHDQKKMMALRAGRQYVDVADYIQMDGMQAMLFEKKTLGGRVFLGKPVSYYSSTHDDLFGGVSVVGRPWAGNRSRVTYARYQDDSVDKNDDHFFFNVRQQMTEELRTRAYLSLMNGDVRMGGTDLYYMSLDEKVFDAAFGVRHWGNFDANTRVYSPLVQTLGELNPYTMAYGRFTAQILPGLYISPGVIARHADDKDTTNTSYERYNTSLIFEPFDALSASLSLEYWNPDSDDRFYGVSGDVRYRYEKLWEISAGAAYVDYTYFQFSDFDLSADGGSTLVGDDGTRVEVSPNAYTYYLRGKWRINESLTWRVSGEIEDDSDEDDLGYRFRTSIGVRL